MQLRNRDVFTTIHTEGAILPADLLQRIDGGDHDLGGLLPEDYHLVKGEKINEAVNRSWNRLLGAWATFQAQAEKLNESDPGTTLTRERWLLPLFQELGYGRLPGGKAIEVEGRSYAISHNWQNTPIHLVGCQVKLDDRRAGIAGASRTSPHSLVQEFLNCSDEHLWGLVANGQRLRILRDNTSLTRQAYVEFDLEGMMESEVYADFVMLWLLCHQSRVESERPEECWLEKWSRAAQEQGTRFLDQLRSGVEAAITALGGGFLAHPVNQALRQRLRSGELSTQDYYRQVLRLVYRLLFLFVAEDRDLLLAPDASPETKERYQRFYSMDRLRRLAERRQGSRHADLYYGLRLIMSNLGGDSGCPELGLPALGSKLWSFDFMVDLENCAIANHDLLTAIRALAFTTDGHTRRRVDYKNLGAEELGSVYESLLELHPELHLETARFELKTAGGNERKTTGSYYTPESLVQCLLDSALDPVLDEAAKKPNPEAAILALKVCDPACGSGHFLIAAAHRVAKRLASVRTGDDEPSPDAVRKALRDVVGRCIYGVDVNPMAVELCKVSLWLEALEPGKPLSFLDHRIQCGNSLIGATPALLQVGIPDEAFTPIEGDDKAYCAEFKKHNKQERQRRDQGSFWDAALQPWDKLGDLARSMMNLDELADGTVAGERCREQLYGELVRSSGYLFGKFWADAWSAAFVWKKTNEFAYPITEEVFRNIERNPHNVAVWMREEVQRLSKQYQFFHWHLAFPDVFHLRGEGDKPEKGNAGWDGGFDVVLGNPPWERVKLQEKEWFAHRRPGIVSAPTAAHRRRMIEALASEDLALYSAFLEDRRQSEGESHFVRNSSRYPLCGRGDINTYAVFAETNRLVMSSSGRVGCIVPTGIASDDTTKFFFQDIISSRALVSLYSFENEEFLFPGIHHAMKFCLLTLVGFEKPQPDADFVFYARRTDNLKDACRHFTLTADDIRLLNPNTLTCPVFRSQRDAEMTINIYSRVPVLIKEGTCDGNAWSVHFATMFHMANDSHLFRTSLEMEKDGYMLVGNEFVRDSEKYLPLYEAKMYHLFDHRFGSYEGQTEAQANQGKLPELNALQHSKQDLFVLPRYWVPEEEIDNRLTGRWKFRWFLSWRNITNTTNERSVIASILPWVGAGHSCPLVFCDVGDPVLVALLFSNLCALVFDYSARQKIGGTNLTYGYLKQFPIPPPGTYDRQCEWSLCIHQREWFAPRVLELIYTADDLEPFARDHDYDGPPFRWSQERRFLLRCELNAAYFHLYGIERDDVNYIMETFPIVKRKDEEKFGEYRTKRVILEIYDEMQSAMETGVPYQTRLDPPPGPPCDVYGNFIPVAQWNKLDRHLISHIHLPKEEAEERPEEISPEEFAAMVYPATDSDWAISAAALALVEQAGDLSSMEHLDALLLATHPDWCKAFLDQHDQRAFSTAMRSAPNALFVAMARSIRWKECRDYLEQRRAISVRHGDKSQTIGLGADFASVKSGLPGGVDKVVGYAIKAMRRIAELRKDLSTVPEDQVRIIQVFEQHKHSQLAA